MRRITFSDVTMRQAKDGSDFTLSFREKLELARILDKLGLDAVETGRIGFEKTDALLVKSLSTALENATLTVPVPVLKDGGAAFVQSCLSEAKHARLQVALPVSTVQMEYLFHKKPEAMLALLTKRVAECRAFCEDVEFLALDSFRADRAFLLRTVDAAIESGATLITVSDAAGDSLPNEVFDFVKELREAVGGRAKLGILLSDRLGLSEASAVNAIMAGADDLKVSVADTGTISLEKISSILSERGSSLSVSSGIRMTELHRTVTQAARLFKGEKKKRSPFENAAASEEDFVLGASEDVTAVRIASEKLGYDLTEDDVIRVYEVFSAVAAKKGNVNAKELDAMIATSALQVPPTYRLESYLVNSGNTIGSNSHVRLSTDDSVKDGLSVGDGPIDASFLAIEQIIGTHYELDDFQIRAVTEGREAMGETVVRLRSNGKLYSGRGISTDIVGSSIRAYINALNKIVYEEERQ